MVTEKKKKPARIRDNNISQITDGKKKSYREKKERANLVTPIEKNQEICNQLVKRTKTHRKMLQATITKSAQYSMLRIRYPEESFRQNSSRIVPDSQINFFNYIYISEFKPVKLHLKIDLVSYPARAEGLVNMYIL